MSLSHWKLLSTQVYLYFLLCEHVSSIFFCTLLSTEMFGGLLKPMSFCLAALLWTCMAQKMLSNRAACTAKTWLKTGQASRNDHQPWRSPCTRIHTHRHTHRKQTVCIIQLLIVFVFSCFQVQSPRGSQTCGFMGTLHVHNADGRTLCTTCFMHLRRSTPLSPQWTTTCLPVSCEFLCSFPYPFALCFDIFFTFLCLVAIQLKSLLILIWPPSRHQGDSLCNQKV